MGGIRHPLTLAAALLASLALLAGCSSNGGGTAPVASIPSVSPSARTGVTLPPVHGRFDYQLGGPYQPAEGVTIVERDHTEAPAPGVYNVCYINAFQTQPGDLDFWSKEHPEVLLSRDGKHVEDPDWPGEIVLDTSTDANRTVIAAVDASWMQRCANAGYRAVEPDNLDSWTRSQGALTQADGVALAVKLAAAAHVLGLAIAQKNTPQLESVGRDQVGFDFAVAEECQVYSECDAYTDVYGAHVIEVEYADQPARFFTAACQARGSTISVIRRDREVVPAGSEGYHYQTCSS